MSTKTLEKVNVKELANQVLSGRKKLLDSTGHELTYVYDPITDKFDKGDKIDLGKGKGN